jgi:predicted dehydrogenase
MGVAQGVFDAESLADAVADCDLRGTSATIVGFGFMGRAYLKALDALGVPEIRVCSRSPERLAELKGRPEVEAIAGGFELLSCQPRPGELAILAVPILRLTEAARCLAGLGFRRMLIEKPVSLHSTEIEALDLELAGRGIEAHCAYNRAAYPSFHEIAARAAREGGITSCTYGITEMIGADWAERFPDEVLERWGIANSLHVINLAHGLIGLPSEWQAYRSRSGCPPWHPAGSAFVGAGISERGIPFSYHADWGSTERWCVEVHTAESSYKLCPLETVQQRTASLGPWKEIPVRAFCADTKPGVLEQVAASLFPDRLENILWDLKRSVRLTAFGEQVFGYTEDMREGA